MLSRIIAYASFVGVSLFCGEASAQRNIITADEVPAGSTWNFDFKHRCRSIAHRSAILQNEDHHLLIIDSGFGKFKIDANTEVQDLNPYTVAFDLSKDFDTPNLEPLWQVKKRPGKEPVVNQGSIWTDTTQNCILVQGGHYYDGFNVSESEYHLNKTDYPAYDIWKFDVVTQKWEDITKSITGADSVERTWVGAAATVPGTNLSFYVGGITDAYTSKDTPRGVFEPSSQMLVFDAGTKEISKQKYFSEDPTDGYWHGSLDHLSIGCDGDEGFLVSLMSEKWPLNTTGRDLGPQNDEEGIPVPFDTVRLYDIKARKWYEQTTLWFPADQNPPPRSRYCSAIVHDEETNTWDLWIHGGQGLKDNKTQGFEDVWVLSMPSFRWIRMNTILSEVNYIRSHSCHAVGGQLLIIGGYPPGETPDWQASCDPEYIKIMDMNRNAPDFSSTFYRNSTYKSPQVIRDATYGQRKPLAGEWADPALERAFSCAVRQPPGSSTTPTPTSSAAPANSSGSKLSTGVIAGIAVGVVLGFALLILLLLGFCYRDSRRDNPKHPKFSGIVFKSARRNVDSEIQHLESDKLQPGIGGAPVAASVAGATSVAGASSVAGAMSTAGTDNATKESTHVSALDDEKAPAAEVVSPVSPMSPVENAAAAATVPPREVQSPALTENEPPAESRPVPTDKDWNRAVPTLPEELRHTQVENEALH